LFCDVKQRTNQAIGMLTLCQYFSWLMASNQICPVTDRAGVKV